MGGTIAVVSGVVPTTGLARSAILKLLTFLLIQTLGMLSVTADVPDYRRSVISESNAFM